MTILLAALWPALLTALLLGGVAGYWAGLPAGRLARAGAALVTGLALAAGAVAVAGLVPGRSGLWVETAALLLAAYLAGCLVGGGLSHAAGPSASQR
ncbi:hypothetical protein EOE48_08730 [Methylobacterium oryzihabitans]|uniref:Uncharacterized protein n=1 Tax=Methylobacterium oryzihabitans TaxID=2499852 RepID=A0A3S2VC20_9HYPH|nr:hypothetical protein EOE48_08730 [Methylobacterium oryzihabitans]